MPTNCDAIPCQTQSDTSRHLSCDTCRSRFHATCVSVTDEFVASIGRYRGFFWRCDACYEKDTNGIRFEKLLTIMENINNVSSSFPSTSTSTSNQLLLPDNSTFDDDDMEVLETTIVSSKTPGVKRSRSLTPSIGKYVIPNMKKKKLNLDLPDPDATRSASNFQPIPPVQLTVQPPVQQPVQPSVQPPVSVVPTSVSNNVDISNCIVKKCDKYFYLSQFDPKTDTEHIKSFVVNKLNCSPEQVSCSKLVSSKRDVLRPLTFVSFKIGTTKKLAKKIVDKSIWPKGITIKPFEDHSKNGKTVTMPVKDMIRTQKVKHHNPGRQPQTTMICHHNHHNQRQPTRPNNPLQQHPMTCDGQQHRSRAPAGQRRRQQQPALTWRVSQK